MLPPSPAHNKYLTVSIYFPPSEIAHFCFLVADTDQGDESMPSVLKHVPLLFPVYHRYDIVRICTGRP